jgi:hypothetical protein
VKLLGEQLRKDASRLDIRAAKLVSRLSEFQASEFQASEFQTSEFQTSEFQTFEFQSKDQMLQWLEEVLEGERALKTEWAKKLKPAKTAGERRRRGEGNSAA